MPGVLERERKGVVIPEWRGGRRMSINVGFVVVDDPSLVEGP